MAAGKPRPKYVAFLRGINVSGKNKLSMNDLAEMFADAGCRDVETYIQSGNVVFCASASRVRRVPSLVQQAIERAFGYQVPVVLRSAAELRRIAASNPFLEEEADPKALHVMFLAARPKAMLVADLDSDRSPPDRFAVRGAEVYLFCPKGIGSSKLTTAYFDGRLRTISTVRNWNTVSRLVEMVER